MRRRGRELGVEVITHFATSRHKKQPLSTYMGEKSFLKTNRDRSNGSMASTNLANVHSASSHDFMQVQL